MGELSVLIVMPMDMKNLETTELVFSRNHIARLGIAHTQMLLQTPACIDPVSGACRSGQVRIV